jgi:cyclomaltodextrinase / maltogenic alpha-amylase / neopullulanase
VRQQRRLIQCGSAIAGVLLLVACAAPPQTPAAAAVTPSASTNASPAACAPSPLGNRSVYLRGSFNNWRADDAQRFTWDCQRFVLTSRIQGTHTFKMGDEDWSRDADWGADGRWNTAQPLRLALQGGNIEATFSGLHRWVLDFPAGQPVLRMENCPSPPLGNATLFVRGTMNNWAALDEYAFQWHCDAYYLNVDIASRQEFKIGEAAWTDATTFGATLPNAALGKGRPMVLARGTAVGGAHNIAGWFEGEATLRLAFDSAGQGSVTLGPKTFAQAGTATVKDAVALSVLHDSRDANFKHPFGAVPAGTAVNFALTAATGIKAVTLVMEKRRLEGNQELLEYGAQRRVPMRRMPVPKLPGDGRDRWAASYTYEDIGVYGYYFEVDVLNDKNDGNGPTTRFIYQNNRDAIYWTRERGSNGVGVIEAPPDDSKRVRRYRHTVYMPSFDTPAWAKQAIYYYVFPDRFRNGDPSNDPRPGVTRYHDKTVEFHADWNSKPFRPNTGDGSDSLFNNDFFGGDLAGLIEKLDYIAELGANTIYMTPVFRAASNHKYDTGDYKNIDPNFGTNADFERLTREASKRGLRVIPDTSLNHVGVDSLYFDRFGNFGGQGAFTGGRIRSSSPYASWFTFDASQSDPEKQYKGWVGVGDLPELDKNAQSFRNFAYRDRDSVMKLWLDRGAAGWRMDVAPWVPDDFWRGWRAAIKAHRPDAVTIAETWFDSSKYFLGDMFDSTMNYIFRNAVLDYANGQSALTTYRNIELTRELYPKPAFASLMNLISSHDQARALHVLGDDERARQRLRLATFMQMVLPGAPAIYYGDEVGVTGGDDPYNRATYPWADRGGRPDTGLLAEFKAMLAMRKSLPVLRDGILDAPVYIDANVIVWLRVMPDSGGKGKGNVALVAVNNHTSNKTVRCKLPGIAVRSFENAMVSGTLNVDSDDTVALTVPAGYGVVWVSR